MRLPYTLDRVSISHTRTSNHNRSLSAVARVPSMVCRPTLRTTPTSTAMRWPLVVLDLVTSTRSSPALPLDRLSLQRVLPTLPVWQAPAQQPPEYRTVVRVLQVN